jgi:hypothetical protein
MILLLAAQAAGQPVTSYYPAPQQHQASAASKAQAQAQGYAEAQRALNGQQAETPSSPSSDQVQVLSVAPGQPQVATPLSSTSSPAANAVATSPPVANADKVLWRNIESGMTVAQLRALYPAGSNVTYKDDRTILSDVAVIEGCQAKVNVMHPSGAVTEIVMRGEGAIAGRCSLKIITALSGKYGEPLDKDKIRGSLFSREGKNYIWTHDGVTLQFKRYTNGPLGGGGLLAASWELRYSSAASSIDL